MKLNLFFKSSLLLCMAFFGHFHYSFGQEPVVVIPSSRSTGSLEKNVFFYANQRFKVTQTGSATIYVDALFDGRMAPTNTSAGLSDTNPTVITIENLPNINTQRGGWIGWVSRYWPPSKFKIEVYNTEKNANTWVTVADKSGYGSPDYMIAVANLRPSKIRFTFYKALGTNGVMQLSELFFIHPEATYLYDGVMVKYDKHGNVGIGTTTPDSKLAVNGNIRAKEIKLETANWPDYVFDVDYQPMTLEETKTFIEQHGHLPGLKSAAEYEREGVNMMELNQKLLEKIEELTLNLIQINEANSSYRNELSTIKQEIQRIKDKLNE